MVLLAGLAGLKKDIDFKHMEYAFHCGFSPNILFTGNYLLLHQHWQI